MSVAQTAEKNELVKSEKESSSKSKLRRSLPQLPQGVKPVQSLSNGRQLSRKSPQTSNSSLINNTLDLTTVSELSELSQTILLNRTNDGTSSIVDSTMQPTPKRDIVSPVRFTRLGEGEDSSVTVAVRVRPLNDREIRQEAKQVVRMHNNETIITSSDGVQHRFYYDHCFWSVENNDINFADQKRVYKELAQPLLDWSFVGYNTCLFAYGQTGSGKSYCIMGEGDARGIVPQFSQELFDRIEGTTDSETVFKVQVSYYEIYKEMIYDLLASTKHKGKHKLRVREHPVMGPYVEDLSKYVATSFSDIEHWINLGNRFRATAATGMNDRSSRSHAVFTILLTQTSILEGEEHNKVSRINLIDLAGSERSSVSKTSGERLKEGASINRSLHALGKVISLLSEKSTGKRKKAYIPYRDSTLTWLLKESLGGNSKTAMIATISPANLHYEESLSTLRYAQQARTIINVARVNEDPNAAIIRDLRQEIGYLNSILGDRLDPASSVAEVKELREKLRESEKLMSEVTRTWQQKLFDTETRKKEELEQLKKSGSLKVNSRLPNLVNLTEDPQLSETLLYVLKEGVTTVGRQDGTKSHDIELTGALIVDSHCQLVNEDGGVTIEPSSNGDAQTFVNGTLITTLIQLHHGDRVVLGGEYFFRFNSPAEVEKGVIFKKGKGSFEYARNELISVQTARLEAELEEKRLKERESLMVELQSIKNAAQEDMDRQRSLYEEKLSELAKEMEDQSMEVSIHQRTKEETELKMEELLRQKQLLEEETLAQKHIIQLEQMKTEKEYEEMKEQKSKLMTELEKEKNKLEDDINKLGKNKQIRESRRESTMSMSSATLDGCGSELVKLSMMLHEASAICKGLHKPLTFSRDETLNEHGELEAHIRVTNTQLGQVTHWNQAKFESRLEQMRDIYQNMSQGSVASLDESVSSAGTSGDENDPFYDPTDLWVKDSMLTPHPSPHRAAQLRRSLLSAGSSPLQSPSIKGSGGGPRLLEMLSNSLGSWTAASPTLGTPNQTATRKNSYFQFSQSVPRVCCDKISSILKESTPTGSVYQSMVDRVHQMRTESRMLEEAYDEHSPTPDLNVPFSELTNVRLHTISLYASLELLLETARSLQEQCQTHETLSISVSGVAGMKGLTGQSCEQLLKAICQQTALYCSKLLQGIENGVEDSIKESCHHLHESLDSVVKLTGQLCLARRVQDKLISTRLHPSSSSDASLSEWLINDDFLSLHLYQKSAALFYQGHCEWCTLSLEWATHTIQDRLTWLGQTEPSSGSSQALVLELLKAVQKIFSSVLTFLQRLSEMQVSIWNLDSSNIEEGTLPLIPNLHHTVDMLFRLQQVQSMITSITKKASELTMKNLDQLSSSNAQVAHSCNELAASVLAVIKSSVSDSVQELSHEVQALSHEVARAGKNLNHLIKKGLKTSKVTAPPHRMTSTDHNIIVTQATHEKPATKETKLLNGASRTKIDDCNIPKTVMEKQTQKLELKTSETMKNDNDDDPRRASKTQTISKYDTVTVVDCGAQEVVSYENTESCTAVKIDEDEKPAVPITAGQVSQTTSYSNSSAKLPEVKKCQTEKTSLATGQVQYMPDSPLHSSPPTTVALNGGVDSDDDDESSLI